MSWPPAIKTFTVTFGPGTTLALGTELGMKVDFTPSTSAVWAATGTPLIALVESATADEGQEGSATLPNPDQDGFIDGNGNTVKNWTYRAAVSYTLAGRVVATASKVFTVTAADTTVDLDTLIPVTGSSGVVVAIPDTWSATVAEAQAAADEVNVGRLSPEQLNDTIVAVGDGRFARAKAASAVSLSPLPGLANGTWQWNGVPWSQDNVVTFGDIQYAVWVNDSKNPVIGMRALPGGPWTTFDLSTLSGNPFRAPTLDDGHNNYAMGADSTGRIHLIGNQHGQALQYVRMNNPGNITSWTTATMVGTEEDLMTYPQFFNGTDGTLYFHYRNGASANGNNYLNKYAVGGGAWSRVAFLVDGITDTVSAYNNRIAVGSDGVIHYSFAWKTGTTYNDISDIGYMRSADGGATWTTITGAPVAIPLRKATAPTILDTADSNSGVANQVGMDVDSNGYPHIATFFFDGTNRQINHLYYDGAAWQNVAVTSFALTANDFTHWPSRPGAIFCYDDRVYIPYRYQYEGKRGSLRMIDVTPGRVGFDDFPIANLDLREWEGALDTRALKERGELTMLIGPMNADAGSPRPEYWGDDNWSTQWVGVLTIDLDRLESVQARTAVLPEIRPVGRFTIPYGTVVSATNFDRLAGAAAGAIITSPEQYGKLVFVRLSARASVSAAGTTLSMQLHEQQQGNGNPNRTWGTITFNGTTTAIRTTPWMPLMYGPRSSWDEFVEIYAKAVGGGTGSISAGSIELGVLV